MAGLRPLEPAAGGGPMAPMPWRVAAKRQDTGDTWTLTLEPAGEAAAEPFRPGQFAMLYAFGAGEVPISVSDLSDAGRLVHTVRAVGATTRRICQAEPGEMLGVRGPFGTAWPVREAEGADVVVVAGGIGLAPLRPAILYLLENRERYESVSVLYGGRSPEELLYASELERWRGRFDVDVEVIVDAAPTSWRGRVGVVTKLIPHAAFAPERAVALVCGPEVMIRFTAGALGDRGVPAERIHVSMERSMKCAIGHCGHCQWREQFVCRDGPVFRWDVAGPLIGVREL